MTNVEKFLTANMFDGVMFRALLHYKEEELVPAIATSQYHASLEQSSETRMKFDKKYGAMNLKQHKRHYLRFIQVPFYEKSVLEREKIVGNEVVSVDREMIIEGSAIKSCGGYCLFQVAFCDKKPVIKLHGSEYTFRFIRTENEDDSDVLTIHLQAERTVFFRTANYDELAKPLLDEARLFNENQQKKAFAELEKKVDDVIQQELTEQKAKEIAKFNNLSPLKKLIHQFLGRKES